MIYIFLIIYAISCLVNTWYCNNCVSDIDDDEITITDICLVFTPLVNTAVMFACIALDIYTFLKENN
jgi:hypothetical protein